jgi:hypothetical protein
MIGRIVSAASHDSPASKTLERSFKAPIVVCEVDIETVTLIALLPRPALLGFTVQVAYCGKLLHENETTPLKPD